MAARRHKPELPKHPRLYPRLFQRHTHGVAVPGLGPGSQYCPQAARAPKDRLLLETSRRERSLVPGLMEAEVPSAKEARPGLGPQLHGTPAASPEASHRKGDVAHSKGVRGHRGPARRHIIHKPSCTRGTNGLHAAGAAGTASSLAGALSQCGATAHVRGRGCSAVVPPAPSLQ